MKNQQTARLASGVSLVFLALSALHFYWAMGGLWPGSSPETLARAVFGRPGATEIPGAGPTALVAIGLALAALLPWGPFIARTLRLPLHRFLMALPLAGLSIGLLLRGIASYVPAWRAAHDVAPFAALDLWLYGPLCLVLGVACAILFKRHLFGGSVA